MANEDLEANRRLWEFQTWAFSWPQLLRLLTDWPAKEQNFSGGTMPTQGYLVSTKCTGSPKRGLLSIDFWIWNFNFMKLYTFKMKYRYKILQITSNSDFILKDLFVFDLKIYSIMLSQKRINIYINVFKWEAFEYFFSKYSVCTLYIFYNLEST